MPDEKAIRDFEKGVLRTVLEELCDPGDHHEDCPRRQAVCPHVGQEVTDGDE